MSTPGYQDQTFQSYNRNSLETVICEQEDKGWIRRGKVYVTTGATGKPLYNQMMMLRIRNTVGSGS
jgi:hypothetical protein